jgi:hypothetical protein
MAEGKEGEGTRGEKPKSSNFGASFGPAVLRAVMSPEEEAKAKSTLANVDVPRVRRVKIAGETPQQEQERYERELELEAERENEGRRVDTGQVLPVHYDDQ